MDALEGNFFKCLSILYSVYSSISSKSTMKENGQDSAIRGLDQAFKDSKDWNLNIDTSFSSGESPEIIQSPTVLSMGKCPHHCMGGACMHGFTNVSRSMSPILSGYQRPPTTPKRLNPLLKFVPSTPERSMSPNLNPFRIKPSIPAIPIRYNHLFQNPLLPEERFCSNPDAWSAFSN